MIREKPMRINSLICGAAVLSALMLASCTQEPQGRVKKDSVEVKTVTLQVKAAPVVEVLNGRIKAVRQADIRPQVDGTIVKRFFKQGQNVQKGDPLYKIDDREYLAALNEAEAALEQSEVTLEIRRKNYERLERLYKLDSVSEQELDNAYLEYKLSLAEVKSAQAAFDAAKLDLEYTNVLSPISGIAGISTVTEGSLVDSHQSENLTTVVDLSEIYADFELSVYRWQYYYDRILNGSLVQDERTLVELYLSDGSFYEQKGEIVLMQPLTDETSGSVTVRCRFANPGHLFLPGMAVKAKVRMGLDPKVLLVPVAAVQRDPKGRTYAYVIASDSRVEQRTVELGLLTEMGYEVLLGLSDGDEVVVEGVSQLQNGSAVTIRNLSGDTYAQ